MGDRAEEMLTGLLAAARLTVPDDVALLLAEQCAVLGADGVTVYLVDYEQHVLVPVPGYSGGDREPLPIDSTLPGRCFIDLESQHSTDGRHVWVPLLDGLERVGVVRLDFPIHGPRAGDDRLQVFAALISEMVLVKGAYGDLFAQVRRRRPMSLAAEIAWNLLPPLTFATHRLVISCMLAPAYEVAGDSFDYAVDASTARFAVFDAMGHGMAASWLATVAIAAYRKARHDRLPLAGTVAAIDAALADTFAGQQFVTGVLAELDLASGRLTWHNAGHPAPLLLRQGRVVKELGALPRVPLGLGPMDVNAAPAAATEALEPDDRILLFTDGVTDARSIDGEQFGTDRLADLVARQAERGRPAPETMRRLMHAIIDYQDGPLRDDATTLLVEWHT